ncbi:hypothetical protein XENOCAPTIV_029498 [Xenoophorus captivus]|uniref:Uncharacterized protein n=1 Tax=Xenoophorus captivus TaxID=1517983 RepID=A0ABV0RSK5_9TELE
MSGHLVLQCRAPGSQPHPSMQCSAAILPRHGGPRPSMLDEGSRGGRAMPGASMVAIWTTRSRQGSCHTQTTKQCGISLAPLSE